MAVVSDVEVFTAFLQSEIRAGVWITTNKAITEFAYTVASAEFGIKAKEYGERNIFDVSRMTQRNETTGSTFALRWVEQADATRTSLKEHCAKSNGTLVDVGVLVCLDGTAWSPTRFGHASKVCDPFLADQDEVSVFAREGGVDTFYKYDFTNMLRTNLNDDSVHPFRIVEFTVVKGRLQELHTSRLQELHTSSKSTEADADVAGVQSVEENRQEASPIEADAMQTRSSLIEIVNFEGCRRNQQASPVEADAMQTRSSLIEVASCEDFKTKSSTRSRRSNFGLW